jgi:LysM repeat protein
MTTTTDKIHAGLRWLSNLTDLTRGIVGIVTRGEEVGKRRRAPYEPIEVGLERSSNTKDDSRFVRFMISCRFEEESRPMNFSFDSVKARSKTQNEDFCFDLDTPRGHFFAVLDFAPHDYANLNATLKGKFETIVGSFVSLSRFSADLFLGFLAKEINNFLHGLGQQSGGPELLCSAALCLLSGNRLSYFACGDITIDVLNNGRLLPVYASESDTSGAEPKNKQFEQLGARNQDAPVTDRIEAFTLQEEDAILIMTRGLEKEFAGQGLNEELAKFRTAEPQALCEGLMKATAAAADDRTLLVIAGPYERYVDPVLSDLSHSVASLEARFNVLSENYQPSAQSKSGIADPEFEQRFSQQMEVLKDDLKGKAARIDLLELDEKIKTLSAGIAGKADTAEVLKLQSEVLKLGIRAGATHSPASVAFKAEQSLEPVASNSPGFGAEAVKDSAPIDHAAKAAADSNLSDRRGPSLLQLALVVLVVGVAAAFLGAWLQSRVVKKPQEVWSVKTSGNQILISRLDGGGQGSVTMTVAQPLQSTGEQTFSSFADVQRYIDTVAGKGASPPANETAQSNVSATPTDVMEITVKPGDSLRKLTQQYNVSAERLKELNPTITRWPMIQIGQKIVVPAAGATPSASPQTNQASTNPVPDTIEITVVPGDSINKFALRYRTTPERLRELNPQITNWPTIQSGQRVLVPASPAG